MAIDKITHERSRLVYARICVNLVVNMVLHSSILLKSKFGNWTQPLEYKNSHLFFQHYKRFGHLIDSCVVLGESSKAKGKRSEGNISPKAKDSGVQPSFASPRRCPFPF